MLTNHAVLISFKIINFSIVIFVFIYLFKKYLYHSIKSNILKYKNYFFSLQNTLENKRELLKELDLEIIHQRELASQLLAKVKIWNLEFNKQQQEKISLMRQNALKIQENFKIQKKALEIQNLNKKLLKDVLKEVEDKLIRDFSDKHSAEQFQNTIISQLE